MGAEEDIKAVRLTKSVYGKDIDWTQFIFGRIDEEDLFTPLRGSSRLKSMADADGVIAIPEGEQTYPAGKTVNAIMLK